jgi:hypothetical protein
MGIARKIIMRLWNWRLGNHEKVSVVLTATLIAACTASVLPAFADPCAHLSGYPYVHCSTSIQGNEAIRDYWNGLTERQKYLTRVVNSAVEDFVQRTGRVPTPQLDRSWAQAIAQHVGINNYEEAVFFENAINSSIRSAQTMEGIENDTCAAVRQYSDLGFAHIYRGIMPQCFAR